MINCPVKCKRVKHTVSYVEICSEGELIMDDMLKEAVRRGKKGDRQSLEEIYNETKDMVYFTVLKLVKNENDAQDLVQDIYIKALQKLEELKDDSAFIKWLKIIAINSSKNYLKSSKPLLFKTQEEEEIKLSSISETNEDFLPAEYADQKEKCRLIMEIVDNLPSLQRTAVMLYYFNELSVGEVAEIMETNEGTTKSRLNYARKQIKDKVEEHERKGTKLYGFSAVPFLTTVLHNASKDYFIPADVSRKILQTSLRAFEASRANTAAGGEGVVTTVKAAKESTIALIGKSLGASMTTKIVAGIVAAGLVAGSGIVISKIIKNTSSNTAQNISSVKKTSADAAIENREESQVSGSNTQEKGAEVKDNTTTKQADAENGTSKIVNKSATDKKIAVEKLLLADKQSIIQTLGKPITGEFSDKGGELIYDGIYFLRDLSNKELEFSTHQQNYLITLSSSKYSAYGFYPGMTKQEVINNPKHYPVNNEKDGIYEFDFPENGTTIQLFIDFSMGGNTASEVTMQAFVEW